MQTRIITPEDTVSLRHAVLWPDKPQSYVLLPEDSTGHHYGAFLSSKDNSAPVAVISLFLEPIPLPPYQDAAPPRAARFRKFACQRDYQGQGIGSTLLRYAFDAARGMGCVVIWCDARLETAAWYERRGMSRFGETFFKGEVEYVRMKVDLWKNSPLIIA